MGKKVHKLLLDAPADVHLIGVVSHENDYRLSWAMNQVLNISLVRLKDAELEMKGKVHHFVRYEYTDEDQFIHFVFFKNKSQAKAYLIPEQKSCDFFLYIQGPFSDNEMNELVHRLKGLPDVSTAFKIDFQALKSNKNVDFL